MPPNTTALRRPARRVSRIATLLSVLLTCALAAPLTARAQTRPPLNPPSTVAADPRDAGFSAWREAGAGGFVVAPFVIDGRYQVLVHSAVSRERRDIGEVLYQSVLACAADYDIDDATQRRLVTERAWRAFDEAVAGQPLVALTVMPLISGSSGCAARGAELALLEHAIAFGLDSLSLPSADAATVQVLVGGRAVTPKLVGRVPITRVAPNAYVGRDVTHAIRIYLTYDQLIPPNGSNASVQLNVGNLVDSSATVIEIPRTLVTQLRRELVPWRARRLAFASASINSLPVPLPEPQDQLLREAHRSYLAGAYVDATASAMARVDARRIALEDRTTARMQIGLTFAGAGDEAAARSYLREALGAEPCLRLPANAPAAFHALLDDVRPAGRCEIIPRGKIVRDGLIPGRAHLRLFPQDRRRGIGVIALTAVAVGASFALHSQADEKYDAYRNEYVNPPGAFDEAAAAQLNANIVGIAAWGIWGGSILHAVWTERRFARRLAEINAYGSALPPRVSIGPAPRGVGLALTFF